MRGCTAPAQAAGNPNPESSAMQYAIRNHGSTFHVEAIARELLRDDASALVDSDARHATLRVATLLDEPALLAALARAGHPVAGLAVTRLVEGCCGGCGG